MRDRDLGDFSDKSLSGGGIESEIAIFYHPYLDRNLRKRFITKYKDFIRYRSLPKYNKELLHTILLAGFLMMNDNSTSFAESGFISSEVMLTKIISILNNMKEENRIHFEQYNEPITNLSIKRLLDMFHDTSLCIHGLGLKLIMYGVSLMRYYEKLDDIFPIINVGNDVLLIFVIVDNNIENNTNDTNKYQEWWDNNKMDAVFRLSLYSSNFDKIRIMYQDIDRDHPDIDMKYVGTSDKKYFKMANDYTASKNKTLFELFSSIYNKALKKYAKIRQEQL